MSETLLHEPPAGSVGDVIRRHTFELGTALVWFIVGVAYLVAPSATAIHSPLGGSVGSWEYVWSALYVLGAPAVVYGLMAGKPNHRAAGLILLASGLVMQGVAAAVGTGELRTVIYFIFCLACALRAFVIVRQTLRHA